jgi:hypothetical protein
MKTFPEVCLYIFAACAVTGMVPASVLTSRPRMPVMVVVALLIGGFVAGVLIAAAGDLK